MNLHGQNVRGFAMLSDEPEKRVMQMVFVKDELGNQYTVPERTLPGSFRTFVSVR